MVNTYVFWFVIFPVFFFLKTSEVVGHVVVILLATLKFLGKNLSKSLDLLTTG